MLSSDLARFVARPIRARADAGNPLLFDRDVAEDPHGLRDFLREFGGLVETLQVRAMSGYAESQPSTPTCPPAAEQEPWSTIDPR